MSAPLRVGAMTHQGAPTATVAHNDVRHDRAEGIWLGLDSVRRRAGKNPAGPGPPTPAGYIYCPGHGRHFVFNLYGVQRDGVTDRGQRSDDRGQRSDDR